ncbi:PAS domain-containing protein [Sphingomonas sp. MAH-20]|uniref:histidine kinase n=1 Tax=Sphingomonas horti TaxID=2682842 RepID=A0A6I4IZW6_9SPHN|nr:MULTISPECIES: PAS domain-containing protein [Sphingomonas]MBA2920670.1 PAS domain-containing protein [Sphingomonas sp. CGMCC 1.13658]MVO77606.1 PAS domain-containing protein [Sphingomonas horti]
MLGEMAGTPDERDVGVSRLRRTLGDLVGLTALSAAWSAASVNETGRILSEALLSTLGLDFVIVHFEEVEDERPEPFVLVGEGLAASPRKVLDQARVALGATFDRRASLQADFLGTNVSILAMPLGLESRLGTIVVGSTRPRFPEQTERLLLSVAANQALVKLQDISLQYEQRRLAQELDLRVARRTEELAEANAALRIEIGQRRQAEEALRASELSANSLIENIPGLVAVLTPDGRVERVNRQIMDYCGQSLEELRDWGTNGTVHPEDMPHVAQIFGGSIASGIPYDIEQRLRRFDGEYRWFANRGRPLRDEAGRIVAWHVLLSDIDDRRRAEQALATSERNLRVTIDSIPALAWSARADGTADFFNQHYLNYVGLSEEDVRDWQWTRVIHPDDLDTLARAWESFRAVGRGGVTEARVRRYDGEYRWFSFRTNPLLEDGKVVKWYGVNTEIEDRKRTEDELAARERKLREAHDHLSQAQRLSHTGSFTTHVNADRHVWSDELYRILEHNPEEPPTFRVFRDRIHGDDRPRFDASFRQSLDTQTNFDEVFRIITPRGNTKFLHAVAHFAREDGDGPIVIGSIQDITETKHVEEELRRSEYLLAASERISQTGSFIWDLVNDTVVFSEQMRRVCEIDGNLEVVRPDLRSLYHPDDLRLVDDKIARVSRGEQCPENEERLLMADGRIKYVSTAFRVVHHDDGRRECFGVAQDVTRRRIAEDALDKVRSELAHVTRVTSLGELAASIAHEVNQPLSGIITNANTCVRLLAMDPPDVEGAIRTARRTIRDGNRASEVLSRLRGLFRKQDYLPESLNLNDAAQEVINICRHDLQRRGITMQFELDPGLPPIKGDRVQLQQVILNLVLNAADALEGVEDRPRQIAIRTEYSNKCAVQLAVADTGIGLQREDLASIFDAFYTTKPNGMGIGLSVSRSIVERHGGTLQASSNADAGSTFAFSIPFPSAAAA